MRPTRGPPGSTATCTYVASDLISGSPMLKASGIRVVLRPPLEVEDLKNHVQATILRSGCNGPLKGGLLGNLYVYIYMYV